MSDPWSKPKNVLLAELGSTTHRGLSKEKVRSHLTRYGYNEFAQTRSNSLLASLTRQLTSPFMLVLLLAAAIALAQQAVADALVIAAVVILNSAVGAYQEFKAERIMSRLQRILSPQARVIRDGIEEKIPARQVVPGDIILLEAGDRVSADGRLCEAQALRVNQASLTGESLPAHKHDSLLGEKTALLDQTNMLFASTLVVDGRAMMLVTATGSLTQIGQIASQVAAVHDMPSSFRREIGQLGFTLLVAGLALAVSVIAIGLYRQIPLAVIGQVAISLLVSVIPEGLPVAVTFGLAYGAIRMHEHHVVIRRLAAVERLGYVDAIGVDKTGTLTVNEMTVEKLFVSAQEYQVTGKGYQLSGQFNQGEAAVDIHRHKPLEQLLELTSLATMSTINRQDLKSDQARALTDPTETALAVVAAKAGFYAFNDEKRYPELLEMPFNQELRSSTSVHRFGRFNRYIVKGAPEQILLLSKRIIGVNGQDRHLLSATRQKMEQQVQDYARQGYRVTALAYADYPETSALATNKVKDLTLVGLLAMSDPIRPNAERTLAMAEQSGIQVAMISGDHLLTTQTVADHVGLTKYGAVMHADDLTAATINHVAAVARATPADKMRIIRAWQQDGKVVAMTGDGVNDAPALKQADVGISMGRHGTDVAVEASDVVLLRDQFSDLLSAILIGRLLWGNLRRIAFFFVVTSLGDAVLVMLALLFGLPLPLVATQILWLNLITGGLIALALVADLPSNDELASQNLPPLRPGLIESSRAWRAVFLSFLMGIGAFFVFVSVRPQGLVVAQTAALLTLFGFESLALLTARSLDRPIGRAHTGPSFRIVTMIFSVFALQLAVIYIPILQRVLHTESLPLDTLIFCLSVAVGGWLVERLVSIARRLILNWAFRQFDSSASSLKSGTTKLPS